MQYILTGTYVIVTLPQGQQHSAQVFSLAVLLSSTFVYNQLGAIDAIAIERLAMVCELAKHIKQKAGSGQGYMGGGDQVDFHPAFMWLLRDFYFELREGGRKITPRQYLEETLALVPAGSGRDAENRNQVGRAWHMIPKDLWCSGWW